MLFKIKNKIKMLYYIKIVFRWNNLIGMRGGIYNLIKVWGGIF